MGRPDKEIVVRSQKIEDRIQESEVRIEYIIKTIMRRVAPRNFGDLAVWQKAHEFVLETHRFSMHFLKRINEYIRRGQSPFRSVCKINYSFWILTSGFCIPEV